MFLGHRSPLFCHILRQERRLASSHQSAVNQRRVLERRRLCQVLRRRAGGRSRVHARARRHT